MLPKNIMVLLIFAVGLTGCDTSRMFQPPPTTEEWYIKPGVNIDGVKMALKQCGYKRDNPNLSSDYRLNEMFRVQYCMEDKGFVTRNGKTARYGCQNNARFDGNRLPICHSRGAYN